MDVPKARDLYQKAADMKDPRAVAWQARRMFSGGLGFPKNEEAAKAAFLAIEKELETMATNNLPDAKRSLAFSWGILFPQTRGQQAFAILKSLSGKVAFPLFVCLRKDPELQPQHSACPA